MHQFVDQQLYIPSRLILDVNAVAYRQTKSSRRKAPGPGRQSPCKSVEGKWNFFDAQHSDALGKLHAYQSGNFQLIQAKSISSIANANLLPVHPQRDWNRPYICENSNQASLQCGLPAHTQVGSNPRQSTASTPFANAIAPNERPIIPG